jgi:predicted ATPase/DNA-binding winged helix-turn-helix (wHTH) protein
MRRNLQAALVEDAYTAAIPTQSDLARDEFRWRSVKDGEQARAEKAGRSSKKSEIERGMSSHFACPVKASSGYLEFSFGPFRLIPEQQLLVEEEKPVSLGARGLELLRVLVEHSGEVVSKDELTARIWPDTCVSESNLKVQIAALRRALGEGRRGQRYIATVSGRGYRFVASVKRQDTSLEECKTASAPEHNLVSGLTRPLGRDQIIDALLRELPVHRFITIVGPGGIGKTTVALALANALVGSYRDGVWLVELAALRDPDLVPSAIAAALGPGIAADGGSKALPSILHHKSMLIVLDCCEHLVDAVAAVAEDILSVAPQLHVIATSREPLRANGETVRRLGPLATPLEGTPLTVTEAIRFPAIQLFVERAAAVRHDFELNESNVRFVTEICRRLDGIALAIELAARRTDAFATSEILALLKDRFQLLTHGRRTDPPRHQTLAAAIDWSYELLVERERAVLRRLSVFVGAFVLESAIAVVSDGNESQALIASDIGNLVAKSLVSVETCGESVQYRLLDSMHAYARQKLEQSGELAALLRRHAELHRALFCRAEAEWKHRPPEEWLADYGRCVDDVHAALNWAFSGGGDADLGAALAAVSVPFWIRLFLVDERRRNMDRALNASWDRACDGGRTEIKLSNALAGVLLQTQGPAARGLEAWKTAAETAKRLGDRAYETTERCIFGEVRVSPGKSLGSIAGA